MPSEGCTLFGAEAESGKDLAAILSSDDPAVRFCSSQAIARFLVAQNASTDLQRSHYNLGCFDHVMAAYQRGIVKLAGRCFKRPKIAHGELQRFPRPDSTADQAWLQRTRSLESRVACRATSAGHLSNHHPPRDTHEGANVQVHLAWASRCTGSVALISPEVDKVILSSQGRIVFFARDHPVLLPPSHTRHTSTTYS